MRCHYVSDLHLETQEAPGPFPKGDVLIIAGDLCNAKYIDVERTDKYSKNQQERISKYIDDAASKFKRVLLIAGNHEHYDGIFDDTIGLLTQNLPSVHVLDNNYIDIDGVRFFGTTLWSDFEGRSQSCMDALRRRVGEFLLVKKRTTNDDGTQALSKFQPEDALEEFDKSLLALKHCRDDGFSGPMIVISHHAPSLKGLNPIHKGNGLDGAFASDLDAMIEGLENVPYWVHGHTHVQTKYQIGSTTVLANCRGFVTRDAYALSFSQKTCFDIK